MPTPYINIDQKFSVRPASALPLEALEAFWQTNTNQDPEALFEQLAFNVVQVITEMERIIALLICEDWNFTSTLKTVLLAREASISAEVILKAFQTAAIERQSELLILTNQVAAAFSPSVLGYALKSAADLTFPAWQQAALRQNDSQSQQFWVMPTAEIMH